VSPFWIVGIVALFSMIVGDARAQIAPCYREQSVTPCGTMPPQTAKCSSINNQATCDASVRIVHLPMHDVAAGHVSANFWCETVFFYYSYSCYWDWWYGWCAQSPGAGMGGQYYTCRIYTNQLCDEENES